LLNAACTTLGVTGPDPLFEGGQKSVYRVDANGERLVLKVIAVDSARPDVMPRAQREVEVLREIDSPHLVKVRSELVTLGPPVNGVAWLEEYLEGEDLGDVIDQLTDWDDAARMALEVARGLAPMHGRRVVHRDLSLRNVRRRADGSYVVLDPGYARHELRSDLTISGQPGTPGFASPEHLEAYSGVPTAFSDVFCVGILLFRALCGDVPIPYRGDDADYMRRLLRVDRSQVGDFRNDLSPERVAVIDRCLHNQPARRYRNGTALADALEAVA
jgi:serine/threonine-protein kinase